MSVRDTCRLLTDRLYTASRNAGWAGGPVVDGGTFLTRVNGELMAMVWRRGLNSA